MHDLATVLAELDQALSIVAARIPWAERSGNRVVWPESGHGERAPIDYPGVAELYEHCLEIRMADVDAGWFVHPLREATDDPYVPVEIEGRGRCCPFGSDGGGGWFVVDADGEVLFLAPSRIQDGIYSPGPGVEIAEAADSVLAFVAKMRSRALEATSDE